MAWFGKKESYGEKVSRVMGHIREDAAGRGESPSPARSMSR